jgi:endo-1,4-beta-xylanase
MISHPFRLIALALLAGYGFGQTVGNADEPAAGSSATIVALKDVFEDHFRVGVAVNRSVTMGQAFRRSAEDVASDVSLVKQQFNHVVAENDMKWQMIHPREDAEGYDFEAADALVEFATANEMEIAGHTLVWHSQTPNWVFEGTHDPAENEQSNDSKTDDALTVAPARELPPNANQGNGQRPRRGFGGFGGFRGFDLNGPQASREELLARMREHIHTVVGRYTGKVKVWDVVNEAIADGGPDVLRRSPWSVIVGPDFVAKAFEYAHEADPDAILRYNDYGLEDKQKRAKLMTLIKSLQAQKIPVMAIGTQAHCNVSITFETMDEALTEIATLGLPIHVTELDVNSAVGGQRGTGADIGANAGTTEGGLVSEADKRLAATYGDLFLAFVKHSDKVDVVTFWGVNDAVSWRSQGKPLLFDGRNQPKPAFNAVVESISKE